MLKNLFRTHPKPMWAGIALVGVVLGVVILVSLFDWNSLRPALGRLITAKTGRPASIDGDLKVQLWSWNPTAEINGLRLKNPKWADRELMFAAKRITVSVSLGQLLRGRIVLPQVALLDPIVDLERNAEGHASWELGTATGTPKHDARPMKLPAVRRLIIEGGKVRVVDAIRKLAFIGSLVAPDESGKQDASAFQIRSSGSLNDKPFRLEANGGSLLALEPNKPYTFSAHLTAGDIDLESHITVRKPFDLSALDVTFAVSGDDFADVYYLTGLALPNSPKYRIAGTMQVDGTQFSIQDLKGSFGSSDLEGQVEVQTAGTRPKLTAKLSSSKLNIADLAPTMGTQVPKIASAKPRENAKPPPESMDEAAPDNGRLLPDADLQVNRVRGMDADVTYRAAAVTAPIVPMKEVRLHLILADGVLTLDPLSFVLDRGQFSGSVQIDARTDTPASNVDMRIEDVELSGFKSAAMTQPPLQGTMLGRLKLHGSGSSVHKFAANSEGAMSLVIPHGQMSKVIAELTGINALNALGVLLSKDEAYTEIRCGIVDFKDERGSLNTTTVFVDTSKVLITGRGKIKLDSEAIDMSLQGDPKKLRFLRLRSPIELRGTLENPKVGIDAEKLAVQGGVAAALATLLTPVAAAIAFIDPGLAKNKDCSDVMSLAKAGVEN